MRRRSLQFSLRGILLITTVLAVWLGSIAEKAMRQNDAVSLLESYGATIHYEHEWQGPSRPPKANAALRGSTWLRERLGRHYFDTVANVELVVGNRSLTAVEIAKAQRGELPTIGPLVELTDADLFAISHLRELRSLKLICDFDASEAGVRSLFRLTKLETLVLDDTSGRSSCPVTDAILPLLDRLSELTELYLEGAKLTDAGLAAARWPPHLQTLGLSGTSITDAGLVHLQKVTSLRLLQVFDTRVTSAGVSELKKALPNCQTGRNSPDNN